MNLDKQQYLHPHKFGDGLKLMEFGWSLSGTLLGLTVLLASACKGGARGGGDIRSEDPLVGSWAGDRIAIVGDYYEVGDIPQTTDPEFYTTVREYYADISTQVVDLLKEAGEWERESVA